MKTYPEELAAPALRALFASYAAKPLLFLSSGGSALSLLESVRPEGDMRSTTLSVLDERFTDIANDRNFEKLRSLPFFEKARKAAASVFDPSPRPEGESVEAAGERFDTFLKDWRTAHPGGITLATVGIGDDGHIAGMIPMQVERERFSQLFQKDSVLAVGYDTHGYGKFAQRVTATCAFLEQCDHLLVYSAGAEKRSMLRKLLTEESDPAELPAMFLKTLPNAALYTDYSL